MIKAWQHEEVDSDSIRCLLMLDVAETSRRMVGHTPCTCKGVLG